MQQYHLLYAKVGHFVEGTPAEGVAEALCGHYLLVCCRMQLFVGLEQGVVLLVHHQAELGLGEKQKQDLQVGFGVELKELTGDGGLDNLQAETGDDICLLIEGHGAFGDFLKAEALAQVPQANIAQIRHLVLFGLFTTVRVFPK